MSKRALYKEIQMNKIWHSKLLNDIGLFKRIFGVLVLALFIYYVAFEMLLPIESDRQFSTVNLKSDEKSDLLYKGEFYIVNNDGTTEPISLPEKVSVPVGEILTIETVLPETIDYNTIAIRSSQQIMRIYVNGELRTEYDTKNTRAFGDQIASRYVFCPVSVSDAGRKLTIEIVSNSEMFLGMINEVYACEKYEFWSRVFKEYGLRSIFGIVLLILGIFTVVVSWCLRIAFRNRYALEYLGWCVTFAGSWVVGESRLRQMLAPNGSTMSDICYFVIMLAPIAISLYLNDIQKSKYKQVYAVIIILAVLNSICSCLIQLLGISNIYELLPVSHVILIADILVAVATFILDAKSGEIKRYIPICVGLIVSFLGVIAEMILAYIVTPFSGLFLMIGGIVLVISGIFKTISDSREMEARRQNERIEEQKKNSETMLMQLIRTLSNTIEAKDEYTHGHSSRVAEYSVAVAEEMGIPKEEISKIWYAATLHDIGKIGVPDTVLNKPSRLSDEEFRIIKTHTTIGADILSNVEMVAYTADIARHHHERYDGKGYPDGLFGEEISLGARIVSVADAFDAMSSDRVYRKALSKDVIWKEINRNKGIQFDPDVATTFLSLYEKGVIDKIKEESESKILNDRMGTELLKESDVEKLLSMVSETVIHTKSEEEYDSLTGLLTRRYGQKKISELIKNCRGSMIFCDMDNLKTINDLYGHKAGDKVLSILGNILSKHVKNGTACRIGGDEFLVFLCDSDEEKSVQTVKDIINDFNEQKKIDASINIATLSAGICVTNQMSEYDEAFSKADKALYYIKQRGKDGYYVYKDDEIKNLGKSSVDIEQIKKSIMTSGQYEGALDLGYREFTKLYEYISKLCRRYDHTCNIVLLTLDAQNEGVVYIDETEYAMSCMEKAINNTIRNVDICTRYTSVQFLIILIEARDENIDTIMSRILSSFHKMYTNPIFDINYEVSRIDVNNPL